MEEPPNESGQENAYAARRSDAWLAYMAERGAPELAFLLPHLRPSMSGLDCGCGPGAITISLARVVQPGRVIGIDIDEKHIGMARERAQKEPGVNVKFEVGSIYKLAFPDQSFDVALAFTVLEHLKDPLAGLREMYRVLQPGGVIGVADSDWDGSVLAPQTPALMDSMKLFRAFTEREGGSRAIGKHLRRLLRQAGFNRVEATAVYVSYGTPEAVRAWGNRFATMLQEERMVEGVIGMGLADRATLETMAQAWLAWSEDPDAFLGFPGCTAIGWKG